MQWHEKILNSQNVEKKSLACPCLFSLQSSEVFDRASATDLWQKYKQLLESNLFFAAWLAAFFLCPIQAQSFLEL